jgi:hypothetical protein
MHDAQMQIERHENTRMCHENMTIREAMRNPICANWGGATVLGEVSLEEQPLRIENARLKDELDRVCALAHKFLGRPVSSTSGAGASTQSRDTESHRARDSPERKSPRKEGGVGERGRRETFGRRRPIQSKKTGAGAGLSSRWEEKTGRALMNGNEHSEFGLFSLSR